MRRLHFFSLLLFSPFFLKTSYGNLHDPRQIALPQLPEIDDNHELLKEKQEPKNYYSDSLSPLPSFLLPESGTPPSAYQELLTAAFTPFEELPLLPFHFINAQVLPPARQNGPLRVYVNYSLQYSLPYFAQRLQPIRMTDDDEQNLRFFKFLITCLNLFTLRSGLKYIQQAQEYSFFEYASIAYANENTSEEQKKLIQNNITLKNLVTDIPFFINKLDASYGLLVKLSLNNGRTLAPHIGHSLREIMKKEVTFPSADPALEKKMQQFKEVLNPSFSSSITG